MKRREFLRHTGTMCAGVALSKALPLWADTPASSGWRTFEVTTRVEVLKPSGVTHIWVPAALIRDTLADPIRGLDALDGNPDESNT